MVIIIQYNLCGKICMGPQWHLWTGKKSCSVEGIITEFVGFLKLVEIQGRDLVWTSEHEQTLSIIILLLHSTSACTI